MVKKWAGEIVAQALKDEGVEVMFGMVGGHISPIMDYAYRLGINVYQVRHEQAAAYAADAYARVTKKPGVCFGTGGPGVFNMVSAVQMAYLARSPLVCLFGGHKASESYRGALQEGFAAEVFKSITKYTIRVEDPNLVSFYIRKAFRDAMAYPQGPVGIEFPLDVINWEPIEEEDQVAYLKGNWRSSRSPQVAGDPELIQQAVELINRAERPLLVAGDGIHYSDAGEKLKSMVETFKIPFNLRRMGRGAIIEDHQLALNGSVRKEFIKDADLIVLMGLHLGYFENFGEWDTNAKFIQINENQADILPALPTEIEIIGNAKIVVQQMEEIYKSINISNQHRNDWIGRVEQAKTNYALKKSHEDSDLWNQTPIHPKILGKVVSEFIDEETTVVLDSFTASAYLTDQLIASRSGQVIDSGLSGGIGHGIGMGIGIQLARPNKPVFVMMGDGGIGVGGGDIETAARYNLPVVYMIYNDSTLCAGIEEYCYGKGFKVLGEKGKGAYDFIKDIRYDQMYAPLGCHVEHVTTPEEIRPALERSFNSGKTAVINVIGTKDVVHPLYLSHHAKEMFWHLPADEVQEPARKRHHEGNYPKFHNGKKLFQ